VQGIAVYGNLLDLPSVDIGGNQVTVFIDGNTVKNTANPNNPPPAGFGGDGIIVVGGTGEGSDSRVTALISNNTVLNNRDDGIVAVGCGIEDAGSNNHVNVTIINNRVQGSGTNAVLSSNVGIAVSAASGEESTQTICAGNVMRFDVSGNVVTGNRTGGISISGGTGSAHDVQGVVSGNSAKDSPEGRGITVSGGTSGTGNHVHDVTISGNQVSGNSGGGILVTGGTNSLNSLIDGIEIILTNTRSNGGQGILIIGGSAAGQAFLSRQSSNGPVFEEDGNGEAFEEDGNGEAFVHLLVKRHRWQTDAKCKNFNEAIPTTFRDVDCLISR